MNVPWPGTLTRRGKRPPDVPGPTRSYGQAGPLNNVFADYVWVVLK